ncbi:hypothetical protein NW762_013903 [Fusarium torreyae]|uniref:FAD-binding domain-containing protein n=1 Tax=Fusarium torreyae TaxID=1237075 RepID=A0A9W8RND8_9HYPO|nr:hypothetical protein NW762_013903 [Fusarium torreyae]
MLEFGADAPETNDLQLIQLRASERIPKTWRNELITQGNPGKGHPRVWLMGDAIHAMQPNRGQGGNQAMLDCVDALPELLALSKASTESSHLATSRIRQSCETYEDKMFDRAFKWVAKSGGTGMPNIDLDAFWVKILSVVATLALPIIRFFYVAFFSPSVKKDT